MGLKIIVLGAGALGSILAGHLARAGEDVTLIARGEKADYLRRHGITITGLAEFNTPCVVTTDTSELSKADALIVAVKTYDVEAAIANLAHLELNSVLSVQNGVLGDAQLSHVFGVANTLGASASFTGEVLPDGRARFTVNAGFYIGEVPEGTSERARSLAATLESSGIHTEGVSNIRTVQWSKFVAWVGLAPAVLTRLETYKILSDPDSAAICARLIERDSCIGR